MNLPKAIEILTIYKADGEATCTEDLDNALSLGIEALRAILSHRAGATDYYLLKLPGETED